MARRKKKTDEPKEDLVFEEVLPVTDEVKFPELDGLQGETEDEPKAEIEEYVIAEGRAISSLKGILPEGTVVAAKYFPGGEDTIKDFVERGIIEVRCRLGE